MGTLNLLCWADTHSYLPHLSDLGLLRPDIIILAGDLGPDGSYQEGWLKEVYAPWVEECHGLGVRVVSTAGNHDTWLLDNPTVANGLPGNLLMDSGADVCGLKLWGCPWVPDFGSFSTDFLNARYDMIPHGLDVLILHGPPHALGIQYQHGSRYGSVHLAEVVADRKPRLVVFGHDHLSRGFWLHPDTSFVNVTSGCHGKDKLHRPYLIPWNDGPAFLTESNRKTALGLLATSYTLEYQDGGSRVVTFNSDGRVLPTGVQERNWRLKEGCGVLKLAISGDLPWGEYFKASHDPDGIWKGFTTDGRWVKLVRVTKQSGPSCSSPSASPDHSVRPLGCSP